MILLKRSEIVLNNNYMASEAGRQVALDVIEAVRKGEIPNKQEIQKRHGYSPKSAKSMKALETITYKETISPVVNSYEKIRGKILKELETRDITDEKFNELSSALKNTTHDIQLLSGGKTENIGIEEERTTLRAIIAELRG